MAHQMFEVSGMTCESCVEKITGRLAAEPGLRNPHVTLNPPRIHFDADERYDAAGINRVLRPLGKYQATEATGSAAPASVEPGFIRKYLPLLLLFSLTAGVPALQIALGRSDFARGMHQFMGATLIALSYFKLVDLPKFAEAFATYDPLAARLSAYGYVYPFFELAAGIGFVSSYGVRALSLFVILFLLPTTVGVVKALREKRKFQCACLGTAFNLPLTKVTIVENALMMAMSAVILLEP